MVMRNNHQTLFVTTGLMLSFLLTGCNGGNSSTASTAATTNTNVATAIPSVNNPVASAPVATPEPVIVTPVPVPVPVPVPRYLKLDAGGNELPTNASSWRCVKDKDTGLVWETKTDDGGLQDKDWRYRHFHNSGGYASSVDYNGKTLCQNLVGSSSCDAYSYMNALQGSGLCGRSNWRLPLMEELLGLVQINANGQRPNIDLTYFPETINNPGQAAYCSENMSTYNTCGAGYQIPDGVDPNAHTECNYQGVDYGLGIRADNPRGDSMVALRYYGEVLDGKTVYPNANWICYTRLVSSN